MGDICFLKFGNTVKTGNCLDIVASQPNDRLYCGFDFCMCFKVWVPFYCGHPVQEAIREIKCVILQCGQHRY
jgi:hypothetical protein